MFFVYGMLILINSYKEEVLNNLLITEDFGGVTSGIRTHDIQNHNALITQKK